MQLLKIPENFKDSESTIVKTADEKQTDSGLFLSEDKSFLTYSFVKNGKPLEDGPVCGMTLRQAGTMRFRWNEENPLREKKLAEICGNGKVPVPVELIHSQIVYDVKNQMDTEKLTGDGMITINRNLVPVVTVADCVPIYLYDTRNKVFGIVHSGWKGTGIIGEAIDLCCKNYGSSADDICVIIGPHIHDCCYIVNQERSEYFASGFSEDCVVPLESGGKCYAGGRGLAIEWANDSSQLYRLSLLKANLAVLKKHGILSDNICVIDECTCCNELFGSNRREIALFTKALGRKLSPEEAGKKFTVQAAFIKYKD